jgi:FkbM family methyltransferase
MTPDACRPGRSNRMPTDVTVVVPTKNAARTLSGCLRSLRAQTQPCRTVVVDNGSTDDTRAIAERWADVVLDAGPERSAQRNYGARLYPADVVAFVDADMVLQPTVLEEALVLLRAGAGAVIVPERTVGSGFWVGVRAFERSFYDGSDAIEAARVFRWDVFDRAGGFDEQLTGPEDWDLTESARQIAPIGRTTAVAEHDEGCIGYLDACRKKAYYAEGLRRYVAKHGASALRQASCRPWLRQPHKLVNRYGVGLMALKAGEVLAVAAALAMASIRTENRLHSIGVSGGRIRRLGPRDQPADAALNRRPKACAWIGQRGHWVWRGAARALKTVLTTRQGGRTVARIGLAFIAPRRAGDVTFFTKSGQRLVARAAGYQWWPIVEVVSDDCYRLGTLVAELQGTAGRILDIGADIGAFSVSVAAAVPWAEVTAVEPSADRASYLRRNLADNGLADRVSVVQAAVGGEGSRRALLDEHGQTYFLGAKEGESLSANRAGSAGEVVDVVAFNTLVSSFDGQIDLVKMDCEGSEYDIVASASPETLRRIERLILKYHPAPPDKVAGMFARLAEAGLVERWRLDVQPGQRGTMSLVRLTL